ncbi:MAG: sugar O-acetyltransferase [Muribaculaceae bacterium]|nr:sugar O-acetyltransferase [Muribaculaceae bacterium]MDE6135593.1 sugar O-acetyltransferase [Muribaculaceae bacterium]
MRLLLSGEWMNGFTDDLRDRLERCEELCFALNAIPPSRKDERRAVIKQLFGAVGERFTIHSPFHCDFGFNISVGEDFVCNFNVTILDEALVTIGKNVFIGPNTTLCCVVHALDAAQRNAGIMKALPITIGDNVWIAAGVTVLPGVTIGEGAVVGAASVVTRDVEPFTVVAGNPARPIRKIEKGIR